MLSQARPCQRTKFRAEKKQPTHKRGQGPGHRLSGSLRGHHSQDMPVDIHLRATSKVPRTVNAILPVADTIQHILFISSELGCRCH